MYRLFLLFTLIFGSVTADAARWEAAPAPSAVELAPAPIPPGDWLTREGLYARVHTSADDTRVGARLAEHAEGAIPEIAARLQVPAGPKMEIYLADSQDLFRDIQPGTPPGWADGTAYPHRGLIFLRSPRIRPGTADPLEQVLEHEIVHVLLGQAFGARPVPRWLQEGLAQVEAGEYTPAVTQRIASGLLGDGLLTLEDLTSGFPADPVRASLAYAQSADLIAFINAEYGPEAMPRLIRELSQGAPINGAFRAATGSSAESIDDAWRARLHQTPMWLQPLTSDGAFWTLSALLFVGVVVVVRRRNQAKIERWDREEALQDALYRAIERNIELNEARRWREEPPGRQDLRPDEPSGPWVH